MLSFTTVYRAVVMVAAVVIVVKGWQSVGPSTQQMKGLGLRAIEIAQSAWNGSHPAKDEGHRLATAPAVVAPSFETGNAGVATGPLGFPRPELAPAAAHSADLSDSEAVVAPPMFAQSAPAAEPIAEASEKTLDLSAADADRLPMLMTRLEELGGIDPRIATWGNNGELYRFRCRAALASTPNFTRHFESVAAEPLAAVEDVVAKVEAWRTADRVRSPLR